MDEKPPTHANIAYLPASGGLSPHPPSSISPFTVKREVSLRCPCGPDVSMPDSSPANSHFSQDISRMPDYPQKKPGHRRAYSAIVRLPDDIGYGHFSVYTDMGKPISSPVTSGSGLTAGESSLASPSPNDYDSGGSTSEKPRVRHHHSYSMDGSTTIKPEMLTSPETTLVETKKAMSAAQLADLALVDPKRAKRILANRQSAARSKERKMRYIAELERKVQTLKTDATTLSAQLTMLQGDTNGLTAENSELKLRLQAMEQQARLQDALSNALREEVQRLKLVTGEIIPNGGQVMSFGSSFNKNQQYCESPSTHSFLPTNQFGQLQIHSQHQEQTDELKSKVEVELSPTPMENSSSNPANAE